MGLGLRSIYRMDRMIKKRPVFRPTRSVTSNGHKLWILGVESNTEMYSRPLVFQPRLTCRATARRGRTVAPPQAVPAGTLDTIFSRRDVMEGMLGLALSKRVNETLRIDPSPGE